jgi:hypothetical protein
MRNGRREGFDERELLLNIKFPPRRIVMIREPLSGKMLCNGTCEVRGHRVPNLFKLIVERTFKDHIFRKSLKQSGFTDAEPPVLFWMNESAA